jgi:nicotinate-nucleotide pyrophosphorylase (carboxylating)
MKDLLNNPLVAGLIDLSFKEDIGNGDHTSLACINPNSTGKSVIVAKEEGILAGAFLALYIFKKVDAALEVKQLVHDGSTVSNEQVIMEIYGSSIAMLTAHST